MDTPAKIIKQDGRPQFGIFGDAVSEINVADFDYRTPMGKPAGRFKRWVGFKQFEYFGVISDQLLFGCALANLKHSAILFCYVYLPESDTLKEYTFRSPLAFGVKNANSPKQGETVFSVPGCDVRFSYQDQPRVKSVSVNIKGVLEAELSMDESQANFEPMSICTQIGRNGWVYAHKVAAVPVTGTIKGDFADVDVEAINAYGHHDFSAGYMRRETFWNWACISGQLADGRSLGLNVSCGVNETSYSENCLWLDGVCVPVGQARFDYQQDNPMQPWRITTADGCVDLTFEARGLHHEKVKLGFVDSNFKQVFGCFNGLLKLADGSMLEINNQYGFVEDQYAKW